MRSYPVPFNEPLRLAAVKSISQFRHAENPLLKEIAEMVRRELKVPSALVSIVDEDVQWFAARQGFPVCETSRDYSMCAHVILKPETLIVCDTLADPKFRDHPVVVNAPYIRFYAGVPIVSASGQRLGSLCALDYEARERPSDAAIATLEGLARVAARALDVIEASPEAKPADHASEDRAAKSTFVSLIGHELRTPLTTTFGSLQILDMMLQDSPSQSLVRTARRSTEHLMNVVETVVKFTDAATGELQLNESLCDLGEMVADIAEIKHAGQDGAVKSIQLCDGSRDRVVFADAAQIRVALNALANNALQHGGTEISVGCGQDASGNVELWVSDNGRLEDGAVVAALHKPFVIGGDIDNRGTGGGLGLGLPLTRRLAELHGGELVVDASPDGTTAIIRLPRWREEMAQRGSLQRAAG